MARITVNTTGTNPILLLSTDLANVSAANLANGDISANNLSVTCLQDITITSSTGIYSWTDFCSIDTNKITTPADNEISTNLVIDPTVYFGTDLVSPASATEYGVSRLSQNKVEVQFKLVWNNSNISGDVANSYFTTGVGYISSLAPTVSPEAPVWITPMTIAVDGTMYTSINP
jgi:hypothetical protein